MIERESSTGQRLLREHAQAQLLMLERRVGAGLRSDVLDHVFWSGVLQGIQGSASGWPPAVTPLQADNFLQNLKKILP
jgi:hypothetical protein